MPPVYLAPGSDTSIPLGIENGAKYALIGPDGTRATFNDSTDRDHVGFLNGDGGTSGLDGADIRASQDELIEGDGAIQNNSYLTARAFGFTGMIDPSGGMTSVGRRITKLRRIVNGALRSPLTVQWYTTGGVPVQISGYRVQPLRISNRLPKQFQIALTAPDPRIYSQELHFSQVSASGINSGGLASLLTSPLSSNPSVTGQVLASNIGTFNAPLTIAVYGPITNPVIRNYTSSKELRLTYSLNAGEYLSFDMLNATILLNDTTARDYALNFTLSEWWLLEPGTNDIRLSAAASSAGAQMILQWRDAWE